MSKIFMMALLVVALGSVAISSQGTKTNSKTELVIRPDTTIKIDTIKKITFDTTVITKTYKDTSVLVKIDTTKAKHKAAK